MKRAILVGAALVVFGAGDGVTQAPPPVLVVVFESPAAAVVQALAASPRVDVRWVESGLVVAEVDDAAAVDPAWQGRRVGMRPSGLDLALLRAPEREVLRQTGHTEVLDVLASLRLGTAASRVGDVWLLVGDADAWPAEVLGCHGGLVLPPHAVDPRSLLDTGPPAALRPWLATSPHKGTPTTLAVLDSVSVDSLAASLALLTRDPDGFDADRHVFGDLDGIYSPRVEATMARAVAGIPGASVRRESFAKSRRCGNVTVVDSTYNVIARLPGSVPGTGTFVVGAHVDATGSRNTAWLAARNACQDVGPTPGSEDNASGVACVLEVLRCLAAGVRDGSLDFAFDLEFIAFSGEEAEGIEGGLTGSARYVARRLQDGTQLLGMFNLDMVGSDSLGTRLQVVHNTASRWLADLLVEAAGASTPPIALDLERELDESLASDHNSFWAVNVPALLGADAPVNVLRQYATYHRPRDNGVDDPFIAGNQAPSPPKMVEVTRTFLAALLRFDRSGQTTPALEVPSGVQLFVAPHGTPLPYDATSGFYRLWPGSPLRALCTLYNTGAPYDGPLHVEMWLENASGARRTLLDCSDAACFTAGGGVAPLQTGDRLDFRVDPVTILPEDAGQNHLFVRLTSAPDGSEIEQTYDAPFLVAAQTGLRIEARPNPARNLDAVVLRVELERPGTLRTDVYSAAGRRVATHQTTVQPNFQARQTIVDVPLGGVGAVACGAYYARVYWVGPGGQQETTVVRLIVVR